MSETIHQDILDKLTKVCLCKAITRASIKKAIANGANTLEKVQKATGDNIIRFARHAGFA